MSATDLLLKRDALLLIWELRAVWLTIVLYLGASLLYFTWLFRPNHRIGGAASRL